MKYLMTFFLIPVFCFFMFSCRTGTLQTAPKTGFKDNAGHSQYGDQRELKQFVSDFIKTVEMGKWSRALAFFDRENYQAQIAIGIGIDQYLIEGMMLPSDEFIDENNSMNINNLKSLSVDAIIYGIDDYYAEVRGETILSRGRKVPFTLKIRKDSKGKFTINPPVG